MFFGDRSASEFTAARYYDRPGDLARAQLLFGADVSPATSRHLWCLQSCAGGNDYLLGLGAEKATEVVKSHYATIAPGAARVPEFHSFFSPSRNSISDSDVTSPELQHSTF